MKFIHQFDIAGNHRLGDGENFGDWFSLMSSATFEIEGDVYIKFPSFLHSHNIKTTKVYKLDEIEAEVFSEQLQ